MASDGANASSGGGGGVRVASSTLSWQLLEKLSFMEKHQPAARAVKLTMWYTKTNIARFTYITQLSFIPIYKSYLLLDGDQFQEAKKKKKKFVQKIENFSQLH